MSIEVGSKVWWEDPDDGICSFTGEVTSIKGDVYYVSEMDDEGCPTGGGADAYLRELTELDDDWNCPYCKARCYEGGGCDEFNSSNAQTWVISVRRTMSKILDIEVQASTQEEAEERAMEAMCELDFNDGRDGQDPEYEVGDVFRK